MKNLSISLALIICTVGLFLISGCIGEDKSSTKSDARVSTTEIKEETPTSTPIKTKGDAKIAPWRIPPDGEGVIVKKGETIASRYEFVSRNLSIKSKTHTRENTTWLDNEGNVLYYEDIVITYEPLKGFLQATNKTITFSWKEKSADKRNLLGSNPIFSPSQVVFISRNNSYYSYVTIENKGGAGDVTLIVNANVIETKDIYTFSKVFRMDKDEKVKAIINFPKNFPQDTLVYTISYAPSKAVAGVSFEVRPSSWRDTSQGEVDIERIK